MREPLPSMTEATSMVDGTTLCWVRLFWSCCMAGAVKTTLYMEYNYFRAVLGSIVLLLFDSEG